MHAEFAQYPWVMLGCRRCFFHCQHVLSDGGWVGGQGMDGSVQSRVGFPISGGKQWGPVLLMAILSPQGHVEPNLDAILHPMAMEGGQGIREAGMQHQRWPCHLHWGAL